MKTNINTLKIDYIPSAHQVAVRMLGTTATHELALERVSE